MNAPYLLIPIGLILIILYSISLLFSRLDVIRQSLHRKIWNYSLLATFLVSAVLGILMAIQVNYKLEVPWTEKVLKWHVNFAIALSAIGIFHLIWHWKYYIPFKSGSKSRLTGRQGPKKMGGRQGPRVRIFMIGFIGMAFQMLIIREMLGLFQGNELMISIILFLWLLLTGGGAMTGIGARIPENGESGRNLRHSSLLILVLLILPVFLVSLMYYGKSLFFAPGVEAGPLAFAGFLLLVLTPFCFLNGFAFTYITRILEPLGLSIRNAYAWESAGAAAAGILCTFAILLGIFTPPGGRWIEKLFHPNDEIIATRSGPSGRITITRNGDQVNIFENGVLSQSSGNTLVCEEMTHFTMVQHDNPQNILVIGGLLSGISATLSGYSCHRVDFVEPDPSVFRFINRMKLLEGRSPGERYILEPPFKWVIHADTQYDIILIMLPGPSNLSINRFYTREFYRKLKRCMHQNAIVSIMLPGTGNYVSAEAIAAIGPVMNALRTSFSQVLIYPGENNYLIAGETPLRTDLLDALENRNIHPVYISPGYFDENRFLTRQTELNQLVQSDKTMNSDLKPVAYFAQIAWWLGQFPKGFIWPLAIITVILILSGLLTRRTACTGMFLMGAGASGTEIIMLFILQITAGSMYLFTGLLLACFMAGLALGAVQKFTGRAGKLASSQTFILLSFTVTSALLMVLAVWMTQTGNPVWIKTVLILILSFLTAMLTGLLFASLTKVFENSGTGGKIYVYDMLGAALGALVFPLVVIPILGILPALGIISGSGVLILLLLTIGKS